MRLSTEIETFSLEARELKMKPYAPLNKSSSAGNTNYPCCCFFAFNSKNLNIVLHSPLASSCGPLPVSLSHVTLIFFFKLCLMFPQRTVFFSE